MLTEVTVAATQNAWVQRARELCCRQLEHEVRTTERGRPPRGEDRLGLPAVRFPLHASLDALQQAQWETARQRLRDATGREVTDAELLAQLLDCFLKGGEADGASAYQVIVQQCPQCEGAVVETEEGPVPLEVTKAAMVTCDAERVGLQKNVDQPTPAWLRRGVLARDGRRCRSCGSGRGLMVHHVRFRSRGGPTRAENLVSLCSSCHALVHEGLLQIEGNPGCQLRFSDRRSAGREFEEATAPILEILGGTRVPRAPESLPEELDAAWWREHEDRLVWNARTRRFAMRPEPVSIGS